MKVAFLTTRYGKPSYRFRVAQFLPYLKSNGVECETYVIPSSVTGRLRLFRSLRRFDAVFLQKKMLRLFDRIALRRAAQHLVYDVDDAVMYRSAESERDVDRHSAPCVKRSRRFLAMVRMSDAVLAGNDFLCRWAADHAVRAICFRTVVDTDHYSPAPRPKRDRLVIGWCGSRPTNPYLNIVLPVLEKLARTRPFTLRVVSDTQQGIHLARHPELRADFVPWSEESELRELRGFDIGLMPLPRTGWAEGKCALKALLYMACGAPAVCSAVGAVSDIVSDGEDGFLAASEAEWERKIGRLLDDGNLRRRIAEKARETVRARFSVAASAPRLLGILREVCGMAGTK